LIVMEYQKIGKDSTVYYEVVTDIPKEVEDGATVGIIEPTIDNILKGIYVGSGKAVGDTIEGWKGLYKLAEKYLGPTPSPDLLLKSGLIGTELYLDSKAVFGRAVDTGKYMVKAVKDGFVRDVINGDAESRSKYFTYLFTTLGIGVLGDKGISKIGNLGTKVGKFGEITAKVEGLSPSLGTVTAGSIPYNVMNRLEGQIQLVARKAFGDGNKGIGNGYQYWNKTTQFKNVKVYQRDDIINPNMKDARGRTNLERMQKGLAPLGPDGKSINLHHMTQRNESSIAEVTQTFHKDNSSVIHINPNTVPSGINRSEFNKWRTDYWKNRANDF
ncbi:HNH/ENDO VII family nuclease, partial [Heyndrickxia sporothermodurans]